MKFQILISFVLVALTLTQDVPDTTTPSTDAPINATTVATQPPTTYNPTTQAPKENACQACFDKARKSGQWWVPCKLTNFFLR